MHDTDEFFEVAVNKFDQQGYRTGSNMGHQRAWNSSVSRGGTKPHYVYLTGPNSDLSWDFCRIYASEDKNDDAVLSCFFIYNVIKRLKDELLNLQGITCSYQRSSEWCQRPDLQCKTVEVKLMNRSCWHLNQHWHLLNQNQDNDIQPTRYTTSWSIKGRANNFRKTMVLRSYVRGFFKMNLPLQLWGKDQVEYEWMTYALVRLFLVMKLLQSKCVS